MSRAKLYIDKISNKLRKPNADAKSADDELELTDAATDGEDILTASLYNLMPEDIDVSTKEKKKKKSSGSLARRIVLVISCAVFVTCAVYLVNNMIGKKIGADFYNRIQDEWGENDDISRGDGAVERLTSLKGAASILCLKDRLTAGDNYNPSSHDTKIDEMRAKLSSLAVTFPDLYGWISVSDTAINYPIVQTTDNDYYLNMAPDRTPLVNGSIFADYRNNRSVMRNYNLVVYGHNLTSGGMFHDVERFYKNEDMFRNTYIYIYTLEGAYVYEPFAVYKANYEYQYFRTEFADGDDFVRFANEMKANSIYQKDVNFTSSDRIITLSTCTNGAFWERYALQAKLVQVIS